jgi:tetratricopeptide (TPR) repeat protein
LISRIDDILDDEAGLETIVPGHGGLLAASDLRELRDTIAEQYDAFTGKRSLAHALGLWIEEIGIAAACERFERRNDGGDRDGYASEEEFYTLGQLFEWKGRIEDAMKVYSLSLSLFPESSLLLDGLAGLHFKIGDLQSATTCYEKSLAVNPEDRHAAEMLKALSSMPQGKPRD